MCDLHGWAARSDMRHMADGASVDMYHSNRASAIAMTGWRVGARPHRAKAYLQYCPASRSVSSPTSAVDMQRSHSAAPSPI